MATRVPLQEMARVRIDAPQWQGSHSVPVSQDSLWQWTATLVKVWCLPLELNQMGCNVIRGKMTSYGQSKKS